MNKSIFLFLFFFSHFVIAQKQKILFSSEYKNQMHRKFLKKTKMDSIILFYQDDFVKNNALNFDKDLMLKNINKRIPNENAVGFAVLDWEGDATKILLGIKEVSKLEYDKMVDNYIASIQYAKKLRPKMKWGYYNFQPIIYGEIHFGYDKIVKEQWLKILKNVDFLTPSLYVLDDRSEIADNFSYNYGRSNAEYSIKLGLELNKPVYPFIWHRYSDHSKKSSHALIELQHFEKFVKGILGAKYKNKKVDGVIWWECENFLYNNLKILPAAKDYKNVSDKNTYQNTVLETYFKRINKNINK